jgi:heme o synthase
MLYWLSVKTIRSVPDEGPAVPLRSAASMAGSHTAAAEAAAVLRPATPRPSVRLATRVGSYIELTKPGIVRMVLVTAAAGFFLAAGMDMSVLLLLHTLFGMGLVASGSCGLNEYFEHEADGRMKRTAGRPIPSGRIAPRDALHFSAALSVLGLLHLAAFVNVLTAALVALTLVSYVFLYTPLKRQTWLATLVGAVPGALPILAGWTAGGAGITAPGLALFAILFLWQMPHFYALAWIYRDDYARGGFRMITSIDESGSRTARQVVGFGAALLAASTLPTLLGVTGRLYLVAALILGTAFLCLGVAMAVHRDDRRAMHLFLGSVAYLPLLLLVMVVDRLLSIA